MTVKNTENMRKLRDVIATMAIEDMYLDRDFLKELVEVSEGKKTYEELRQEVIREYAQI